MHLHCPAHHSIHCYVATFIQSFARSPTCTALHTIPFTATAVRDQGGQGPRALALPCTPFHSLLHEHLVLRQLDDFVPCTALHTIPFTATRYEGQVRCEGDGLHCPAHHSIHCYATRKGVSWACRPSCP